LLSKNNKGHLIYCGFNINLIKFLTTTFLTYSMLRDATDVLLYNAVS